MERMLNEVLEGKTTVAIAGHIHPDGDCIGSCVGLYLYLKEVYPKIETEVYLEEVPEQFRFLKGTDQIKKEADPGKIYDLFISLDCGDSGRLGFAEEMFKKAHNTFCVDHHISNPHYADVNYVVPDASSTSELIYRLAEKKKITREIAEALYLGIAHDTGVFLYSCTSPETMEAAADLLRTGIDANDIVDRTYYVKSYVQQQILGRAMLESILYFDGRCISSVITKNMMDQYGAKSSDLEGIVSQLRNTQGVEVAIFLYELRENEFKVSLRSRKAVDVSAVAQHFGGGGHVRAAGVTMQGEPEEILDRILTLLEPELEGPGIQK